MRDIDDIIEFNIVDRLDLNIRVKTAGAVIGDLQKVTFCDMKFLRLFDGFTSGANAYPIDNFDDGFVEVSIIGTNPPLEVGDVCQIQKPFYFRGTPKAVNSEWKIAADSELDKLPMIWLVNPVKETFYRNNPTERDSNIKLFLLCSADFENDLTEDFREKNVKPLMALAEEITNTINRPGNGFGKLDQYETKDFSKFGVEDKTGIIKNIIDSQLSGVDLTFILKVLKENCNC